MSRNLPKSGCKWMKQGVATAKADPQLRAARRVIKEQRSYRLEQSGTPHGRKMARKLRARAA